MSRKSRKAAQYPARTIKNTGYSGGGASLKKNYSRGWEWRGGSHREDIDQNLDVLRQRSRDLWANSPIARAALSRIRDNAVGTGLRLQSTPRADILGITAEEASAWARRFEWEFGLWSDSRDCDALGLNTFGSFSLTDFFLCIFTHKCNTPLFLSGGIVKDVCLMYIYFGRSTLTSGECRFIKGLNC